MAEPMFKLVRCDAEASHMLGWAKKQVKRVIEHAKLDSFQRTWSFGDITIKASYFAGIARLWLEAAGTERMAVWATLPNPVPWRGLSIVRASATPFSVRITRENYAQSWPDACSHAESWETVCYVNGVEVGRVAGGSFDSGGLSGPECNYTPTRNAWGLHAAPPGGYTAPSPYALWSQSPSFTVYGTWPNQTWGLASLNIMFSTPFDAAIESARAAAPVPTSVTYVIASDGEVLAQEAMELEATPEDPYDSRFVPEGAVSAYFFPWNGSSRAAMYETFPTLVFDHWLSFVVPEDVAQLPAENPPTYALNNVFMLGVYNGQTYVYAAADDPAGVIVQPSLIQSRTDEWAAGVEEAKARRAAWFEKNSDEVLQTLQAGSLPEQWDYKLKYYAPESANTYRPVGLSASYDDETVSDTSANLTQVGTQVQERTVEFTYVITVNGTPETREETVVGTLTSVVTAHKDVDDNPVVHSLTRTYTNWYAPAAAPAGTEALIPHQFLKDGTAYGMGLVWNGVVQRAYGGTFPSPTVGNWEYYADSTLGTPGNGLYPFAESGYSPPISAAEVSPAYPPESNTLVGIAPAFVRTYHADVKPQYRASGGNTEWLSSSLMPGMTVTVVPIAPVLEGEPLGIYGEPDVAEVAEVEIYGSAVFSYNYNLGEFVFVEWKPLPGAAEAARIPTPITDGVPDGWNGYNALLIYGGIKWDDVKEDARTNRKALNDPNDPAHDPLMKAVLDALNPPEPAP